MRASIAFEHALHPNLIGLDDGFPALIDVRALAAIREWRAQK